MSLFYNRRPRPFCHRMIYSDDRRDSIGAIKDRSRRASAAAAGRSLRIIVLVVALLLALFLFMTGV